jgi:cytochrome P450
MFMTQVTGPGYFEHLRSRLGSLNRGINNTAARKYHQDIIAKLVKENLDTWSQKPEIDLFEHVSILTHKVIVGCLIGPDFLEHNMEELYHLLSEMEQNIGSI